MASNLKLRFIKKPFDGIGLSFDSFDTSGVICVDIDRNPHKRCILTVAGSGSTTNRGLSSYSTKGDASVPALLHTTPAPTRPRILALREQHFAYRIWSNQLSNDMNKLDSAIRQVRVHIISKATNADDVDVQAFTLGQ